MAIYANRFPSSQLSATTTKPKNRKKLPPIFISTNPSHLNPHHLRDLFISSNHSCHRFPNLEGHSGRVVPVDLDKLRVALSNSSVVVSVFCKEKSTDHNLEKREIWFGELFERAVPVSESNGRLVGFGRAVSDCGLTASVYDVVVTPSLQGLGIGRMIVKRIIKVLTSREIYDIAALCSKEERFFFESCGFGKDVLGSTTMMYTRNGSSHGEGDLMVKCAGRALLLVPPLREPFLSKETAKG